MKYAIADIGSNTIKMTIFDENGNSVGRASHTVGLIGYIDGKIMNSRGITVISDILSRFLQAAKSAGCDRIYPFATASLRSAENRDAVCAEVLRKTGCAIDIIDGKREAKLSFAGIMFRNENLSDSGAIIDMGGGSSEILTYENRKEKRSVSLDIGALTLFEKYVSNIIPTWREAERIAMSVRKKAGFLKKPEGSVCAVGGTIRAIAKYHAFRSGAKYDDSPYTMTVADIRAIFNDMIEKKLQTRLDMISMFPDRMHTVIAGTAAYTELFNILGCDTVTVTTGGARDGYFLELTGRI